MYVRFIVQIIRWRCRLCQLKRDYACKTGHWYHGDMAQPVLEKDELWLALQKTKPGSTSESAAASDTPLVSE